MGRYASSVGGWFRLWSRMWLTDEKIQSLSDGEQGQLVRVLSVANECLAGGKFEVIGIVLSLDQVAEKAKVSVEFLMKLTEIGITQTAPFSIKNWEKWQNPDSKRDLKPDLKLVKIRTDMTATRRKKEDVRRKN